MDKKYRILYNEKAVVDVLEDSGTTFIGKDSNLMVLVDTKENAKTMLGTIGINTDVIDGYTFIEPEPVSIGLDYLDQLNKLVDPTGMLGDIL
jgi:hypothetical protein